MTWKPSVKPQTFISDGNVHPLKTSLNPPSSNRDNLKSSYSSDSDSGDERKYVGDSLLSHSTYLEIFKVLESHGFNEADILNANPNIVKVYDTMRGKLEKLHLEDNNIVTFIFDQCEEFKKATPFAVRVDKDKDILKIIALICRKYNVEYASTFSLKTASGNELDDSLPLSHYGFGSLIKDWTLFLSKKSHASRQVKSKDYVVIFHYPRDNHAFGGLEKKAQSVQAVTPVGQIINLLCKKYGIQDSEKWVLTSKDGFAFSRKESLGFYGLGSKFETMNILFVKSDKVKYTSISQDLAWTQVVESFDMKDVKQQVIKVDGQISEAKEVITQLREENKKIANYLTTLGKSKDQLEEEHLNLRSKAKSIIDTYTKLKEQEGGLRLEKTTIAQETKALEAKIILSRDTIVKIQNLINEKEGELTAQKFEYENEIMVLEQKNINIENDLHDERKKNLDLDSKNIMMRSDITRLELQIDGQKVDISDLNQKIALITEKEKALTAEINSLSKVSADKQFNATKNKESEDILVKENEKISKQIAEYTSERDTLKREIQSIKTQLQTDIKNKDQLIATLEQKSKTLKAEKDNLLHNFEEKLQSMKGSLDKTASTQSGLHAENTKLREQVLNLMTQIESKKSQMKSSETKASSVTQDNESYKKRIYLIEDEISKKKKEYDSSVARMSKIVSERDSLKKQLEQLKQDITKEQKSAIELTQDNNALQKKLNSLDTQAKNLDNKKKEAEKDHENLKAFKPIVPNIQDTPSFKELNSKILKLNEEKQAVEKEIADLKEVFNQLKEENTQQKAELEKGNVFIVPVVAPESKLSKEAEESKKKALSLENEILSIRDTLQKTTVVKKEATTSIIDGTMASILINSFDKFGNETKKYEDLDALDDDKFFVSNDQEEDWD